jgi:hypothetical protein
MPAGHLLLQSSALNWRGPRRNERHQCSVRLPPAARLFCIASLRRLSPKGSENGAANGQHDREFHRAADEAATQARDRRRRPPIVII